MMRRGLRVTGQSQPAIRADQPGIYAPSSSFSPADIAGLSLWLKADAITGKADGDALSQWDDSSGQANHVTQATGAARPTYRTNVLNGKPVVRFDGADDVLSKNPFNTASGLYSIFVVAKGSGVGFQSPVDWDTGSPRICQFRYNGAASFEAIVFSATGNSTDTEPVTATAFSVIALIRRAAEAQVYVNGASNGATARTGTPNAGLTSVLCIGARGTGLFLNGDVAEVAIYEGALSDADRGRVRSYLGTKYGIAVS
jgi:hypothetical protein